MTVWVVKGGRYGEFEPYALGNNIVGIGFELRQSILDSPDRDALREFLQKNSDADQLWRFANVLSVGDIVVMPCKHPRAVAVGRIDGEYIYDDTLPLPHTRPVEWLARDIPRSNFDQDLLYSFGGLATVFRVNRENADARVERVTRLYVGETPVPLPMDRDDASVEDTNAVDLDEAILDGIVKRIRQKFTGNRLEYLVEEILKAQGYTTKRTRDGADGGIDVLAGLGEMGFGQPWLCVQVKSGVIQVDLPDYNRLQGNIQSFGGQHGLLVSLSDFSRSVRNENDRSFFKIRLWGPEELTENLLEVYDKMPADVRADIPLVERKVLLEMED